MRPPLIALLLAVAAASAAAPAARAAAPTPFTVRGIDVDAMVEGMPVDEKVGQLLLLGFGGTTVDDSVAKLLTDLKPGGVALFARNIGSLEQTVGLIRGLRARDPGGLPLFVAVDQEGGVVVRLKRGAMILPSNMALGATGSTELARRAGVTLGHDLRTIGFNMNLAPVLDVNSNPKNPVIGTRSFGEDPQRVGELGVAYVLGLQSEGVLAVAKHFPGHGDTDGDSHFRLPVVTHDKERLVHVELVPFARALSEGLDAVMTAHIALPKVTGDVDMPATMSRAVLTGMLRDDLGFEGLVMTDGLEMQGATHGVTTGEAAVRAVEAGADMVMVLWVPEKKREVRDALLAAVKSGRISAERLDRAVRHVLTAKAKRGLFGEKLVSAQDAMAVLDDSTRKPLVEEVAERAVTIVRNGSDVLPLRSSARVVAAGTEAQFLDVLRTGHRTTRTLLLQPAPTRARTAEDGDRLVALAKDADVVVLGLTNGDAAGLVARVRRGAPAARIVVVSFGSPYLLSQFPDVDGYVCTFGFREESERAAGRALLGAFTPTGLLPVSLPTGERIGSAAPLRATTTASLVEHHEGAASSRRPSSK